MGVKFVWYSLHLSNSWNAGCIIWVNRAFGMFWGWINAYNYIVSSVASLSLYPILFVDYLPWEVGPDITWWQAILIKLGFCLVLTLINVLGITWISRLSLIFLIFIITPFIGNLCLIFIFIFICTFLFISLFLSSRNCGCANPCRYALGWYVHAIILWECALGFISFYCVVVLWYASLLSLSLSLSLAHSHILYLWIGGYDAMGSVAGEVKGGRITYIMGIATSLPLCVRIVLCCAVLCCEVLIYPFRYLIISCLYRLVIRSVRIGLYGNQDTSRI